MNFLIADTFTDSLARLTGEEQKAVKTTAFDLHLNPASPGMKIALYSCSGCFTEEKGDIDESSRSYITRTNQSTKGYN